MNLSKREIAGWTDVDAKCLGAIDVDETKQRCSSYGATGGTGSFQGNGNGPGACNILEPPARNEITSRGAGMSARRRSDEWHIGGVHALVLGSHVGAFWSSLTNAPPASVDAYACRVEAGWVCLLYGLLHMVMAGV